MKGMFIILVIVLLYHPVISATVHRSAAPGSEMSVMNPDISVVIETQLLMTDDDHIENKNSIQIEHIELVFQAYVYPGVFGNVVLSLHEHGDHWDLEAEEVYLSFLTLPLGLSADVGRKLINFGRLNPVHKHHWFFNSPPLAFENLFGDHGWGDNGIEVSKIIPNPLNMYANLTLGWWRGEDHDHHHEDDERNGHHHHDHGVLDFHDHVFTSRLSTNLFHSRTADVLAGFSYATDSHQDTQLFGFDLTYKYRWPMTFRRLRWQNELFKVESKESDPLGFYSLAHLSLNPYWDFGFRYDWTELYEDEDDVDWAVTAYLTYHFNEMMYLRPEYRYLRDHDGHSSNTLLVQLVWGFGPHAHRIED